MKKTMKNTATTTIKRAKRIGLTAILCAGSLLTNACTTTNTAYEVQTQPMNPGLEKKIIKETGLSGMGLGAIAGGIGGAVLGGVATKLAGGNEEQVKRNMIIGGAGGAIIGGNAGYQKGKQEGQKIVASGMTRDKAWQLVKAAQEENQRLSSFNSGLKRKITAAKAITETKERKIAYATLNKQAASYKKQSDTTISMRNKALENKNWGKGTSGARSEYRSTINSQAASNKALVGYMNEMSKLQASVY